MDSTPYLDPTYMMDPNMAAGIMDPNMATGIMDPNMATGMMDPNMGMGMPQQGYMQTPDMIGMMNQPGMMYDEMGNPMPQSYLTQSMGNGQNYYPNTNQQNMSKCNLLGILGNRNPEKTPNR